MDNNNFNDFEMEFENKGNSGFDTVKAIPRKVLPMFFLIDTSGSMAGEKIGSLNTAMEEVLLELKEMKSIDAEIKIAVLEFSTGCKWQTSGLVSVEAYGAWETLKAGGITDMGAALMELDKKLSRNGGYMHSPSGSFAPVIFIMSDGEPVDDFKKGLAQLKQNNWYKAAMKIALAIGEDANEELLADFTGNRETVATVNTKEELVKMIKIISVSSADIGSKSRGIGTNSGPADINILGSKKAEEEISAIIKNEQNGGEETRGNDEPDVDLPIANDPVLPNSVEPFEDPLSGAGSDSDPDDPFGTW